MILNDDCLWSWGERGASESVIYGGMMEKRSQSVSRSLRSASQVKLLARGKTAEEHRFLFPGCYRRPWIDSLFSAFLLCYSNTLTS